MAVNERQAANDLLGVQFLHKILRVDNFNHFFYDSLFFLFFSFFGLFFCLIDIIWNEITMYVFPVYQLHFAFRLTQQINAKPSEIWCDHRKFMEISVV